LLYCYAVPLYRRLADAGDGSAIWWLAELLVEQGDVLEAMEFLRVLAGAGVPFAARRLLELLVEQGRVGELRARADAATIWPLRRWSAC
jgi:hypothetical protein